MVICRQSQGLSAQDNNFTCPARDSDTVCDSQSTLTTIFVKCAHTAFFWGIIPACLFHLTSNRNKPGRSSALAQIRMYTFIFLATVTTVQLSKYSCSLEHLLELQPLHFMQWCKLTIFVFIILMMKRGRQRDILRSAPLAMFWLMLLLTEIVSVYDSITQKLYETDVERFVIGMLSLAAVLFQCLQLKLQKKFKTESPQKLRDDQHPAESASFLSAVFWDWTIPFLYKSKGRKTEEDDVPPLRNRDRCQSEYPVFEKAWKQETINCEQGNELQMAREKKENSNKTMLLDETKGSAQEERTKQTRMPSLLHVLLRAYGWRYGVCQGSRFFLELSCFVDPLLAAAFMDYVQNRENEPAWTGFAIIMVMFLFKIFVEIAHNHSWYRIDNLDSEMSSTLRLAIFRKGLSATNESKKCKSSGQIVSVLGEDVDRVVNVSHHVVWIVVIPVQVMLAFYMLYSHLGVSAIVGAIILLSLVPFNSWVGKKMEKLEKERNDTKDDRVKLMNEILDGMKVLKLYAWEYSFEERISKIREREVYVNKCLSICHACIDLMFRAIPFLVRLTVFLIFVSMGGYLNPAKTFLVSSLFFILSGPFNNISLVVPSIAQAQVSLKRINEFLNYNDIPDDVVRVDAEANCAVSIQEGNFTWDTSSAQPSLQNINLQVSKGQLVAVVGMVGSGKSSLISAVLGEMEKLSGSVTVHSSIAYVAQEAWIQNGTLRENILFGSEFDPKKYRKVVSACALKEDFKILADGDLTKIGEKGVNLSGGQKQRVSLARAVYKDADIYLFDDPLSAVDAHVGKHIFGKVIGHNGVLKEKTRVLVTHGLLWLPFVDNIIAMKNGSIAESGSYTDLTTHDGAFAQFLKNAVNTDSANNDESVQKVKKYIYKHLQPRNKTGSPVQVRDEIDKPDDEDILSFDKYQSSSSSCSDNDENESDRKRTKDKTFDDDEFGYKKQFTKKRAKENHTVDDEETKEGTVGFEVYKEYVKAVGVKYLVCFVFLFAVGQWAEEYKIFWMGDWTENPLLANVSLIRTEEYQSTAAYYLSGFGVIGTLEVVMAFLFRCVLKQRALEAANKLHNKLLANILHLPMSFFDTTPTGRIITRFSKDVGCVDDLGGCLQEYIESVGLIITNLFLIVYITPPILLCVMVLAGMFIFLQGLFIGPARQLRRYRSKYSSPIFDHFKEMLGGTATIRAFGDQERFVANMEKAIENRRRFDFMANCTDQWFSLKLMILGGVINFAGGVMILIDDSISSSRAFILIGSCEWFVQSLRWFIFHASHTEQELVSLERMIEYSSKVREAEWHIPETTPALEWPEEGDIEYKDYQARYREGQDLVLKGISCHIRGGEKIGIVGRTGAGKSSLMAALFRLIESTAGQIDVDGHPIASLGLHDLRRKITILPQDPVIFGGSLRMNLDPFKESSTEDLWEALKHSHLKCFVENLPDQLEYDCGEGGKNLSVGQRQLVCLARTLLRKTKILVLDEATAAVDLETDELIQSTIRGEFNDCTVLTIAHRLNTIIDYDRILVLDQGVVKEFDTPNNLLADTTSAFYSMAKDAKLV